MPATALPTILKRFAKKYPKPTCELNWKNPLQLLVATILAAQCPDERVNQVTPALFARYPDAQSLAKAEQAEVEQLVKTTGFYRNKAEAIRGVCQVLVDRFNGQVPQEMEALLTLPRVARKTANMVLNIAFGQPSGIIVDGHVARVSQRLGLTTNEKPEKIEADLMELVPKKKWVPFGLAMVLHGRYTCTARKPDCDACELTDVCPKTGL
jgi:endonuclease-3